MIKHRTRCTCADCQPAATRFFDWLEEGLDHPISWFALTVLVSFTIVMLVVGVS